MDIAPVLIALFGGLALLLFGIVLLCVVRIISTPRDPAGDEPELLVLVILGWVLLTSGVAAAVLFVCFSLLGPVFGFLIAVAGFVVLGMAVLRHGRARQYTLLSTLAVAAERLMPLAPAIEAFAEERWGLMGRRARRLAARLRSGMSLADALHSTPGLVSYQDQVTIRVGQESGLLARALRDVVRSHELHTPVWNQMMGRALYLGGLIVFAFVGVIPFMMLRIAPELQKIFDEFGAQLPAVTQVVFGIANFLALFGVILVPLLLLVVVGFALLGIQYVVGARWSMPLVNRLTRRLDTAVILEALALAAERNVSFAAELETLARWYPRRWIRRRLQAVLADIKAGIDWSYSLAHQGLIKHVELAVFQAAGRAGNLAWALREMADSNRRRLNYRLYLFVQVAFPLVILVFGLMVMVYVVSYFLPLITLIQSLT